MWFEFLCPFFLKSLRLLGSGLRPEPRRWLEMTINIMKINCTCPPFSDSCIKALRLDKFSLSAAGLTVLAIGTVT